MFKGFTWKSLVLGAMVGACLVSVAAGQSGILDKQAMLDKQTFWDNKDWDWYKANIPFLETPDPDIDTTYYYRWELMTKHLVYGSPASGYNYTEFIDRPGWSGTYGSISCPVGHQLYETRWLKDKRLSQDYARYWFRTPGAQPMRYSCWLEDGIWAVYRTQQDRDFVVDLKDDMINNFQAWKKKHYDEDFGMFWQHGMAEGMETNINSRMTDNWFAGAKGYRPSMTAYMYSSALAIANTARLAGDTKTADEYEAMADLQKKRMQEELWDPQREFFFHMFREDETKKGEDYVIKARTLTHQTGPYAGCDHGREEIGYVPWMFNMPDAGYEAAWKFLMDPEYFYSDFGPTVTERNDPMFYISGNCCVWSGNSWPYATSQTLKAFANLLNNYKQGYVDKGDYFKLLKIYTMTHRKEGRPYIAEACHPDTGSWSGHDKFNHSEHYLHSCYNDLVITGLIGLHPKAEDTIEINPLIPDEWDYFALDDVLYHGRNLSVVWDRTGKKYQKGKGLMLFADGKKIASRKDIGKLSAEIEYKPSPSDPVLFNYAVNNEQAYYPRMKASSAAANTSSLQVQDGAYWYHISPSNRWASELSDAQPWLEVDFGIERPVQTVKLYLLDDAGQKDFVAAPEYGYRGPQQYTEPTPVSVPRKIRLEYSKNGAWLPVAGIKWTHASPVGDKPNTATFPEFKTTGLRAIFTPQQGKTVGVTEFEVWGKGQLPLDKPGDFREKLGKNIALNEKNEGYPKAAVSFMSEFDKGPHVAIDGKVIYKGGPDTRWTTFKTENPTDWIEIDFGAVKNVHTVMLAVWGDKDGVRPPVRYDIQYWSDNTWKDVLKQVKDPLTPAGNSINIVTMAPVDTSKIRVVITHEKGSSSGLTELEVYGDNES